MNRYTKHKLRVRPAQIPVPFNGHMHHHMHDVLVFTCLKCDRWFTMDRQTVYKLLVEFDQSFVVDHEAREAARVWKKCNPAKMN